MVGLGYVGLPLAVRAVEVGFDVTGFDVDKEKVADLARAVTAVDDVDRARLSAALRTGHFRPTEAPEDSAGFDVAVVCVPTPLRDGAPELRFVEEAATALAPHVRSGSLVVLESTTWPGTTEDVFVPLLELGSGRRAGADFHVGYSPQRIDPGNRTWRFENTPKIVSGIDAASAAAVEAFYGRLVARTVPVTVREAELAKLLENTFRHVNIALVNELAVYAHELGIDIWSVIDAAASKPFGFLPFPPGPGVGGHCLPIDPSYLSWQVRRSLGRTFRFVEVANDVNENMPGYVVARVAEHLNSRRRSVNGSRILLVGLAYKPNTADVRESPALAVASRLVALGATVRAVDPHVDPTVAPAGVELVPEGSGEVVAADIVVVLTDHDSIDWSILEHHADRVLDTRRRLSATEVDRL